MGPAVSPALFRLIDRAADSSIVEGFYAPADKRLEADVHLRRIDLSLLDPVLKGVLRETQGMADASLRLTNPGGKLTLDGTIGVGTFRSTGRLHERSLYDVGRRDRCPPGTR